MKIYKIWKTVYMLKMYIISVIHCVLSQQLFLLILGLSCCSQHLTEGNSSCQTKQLFPWNPVNN